MDWNTLFSMLGTGGLVALVNWMINLKAARRRSELEKDDLARIMADRDNETILKLYNENRNILEKLASLERMLYKVVSCRYYAACPARCIVQEYKTKHFREPDGQHQMEQKGIHSPRDHPDEHSGNDNPAGQPAETSTRSCLQ